MLSTSEATGLSPSANIAQEDNPRVLKLIEVFHSLELILMEGLIFKKEQNTYESPFLIEKYSTSITQISSCLPQWLTALDEGIKHIAEQPLDPSCSPVVDANYFLKIENLHTNLVHLQQLLKGIEPSIKYLVQPENEDSPAKSLHVTLLRSAIFLIHQAMSNCLLIRDLTQDLPDEVLMNIFLYLNPQDLAKAGLVSKRFNAIASDGETQQKKLNQYAIFPDAKDYLDSNPRKSNYFFEWYKHFFCLVEYKAPPALRRFVRFVAQLIEGGSNKELFQQLNFADLNIVIRGMTLIDVAFLAGNQAALDYFYKLAQENLKLSEESGDPRKPLDWALLCNQSVALSSLNNLEHSDHFWSIAAKRNNLKVIRMMLEERGVTPARKTQRSMFNIAVENNCAEIVEYILQNPNVFELRMKFNKALKKALKKGYIKIVELILDRETPYAKIDYYYTEKKYKQLINAQFYTNQFQEIHPLGLAIFYGHTAIVKKLIDAGADVNRNFYEYYYDEVQHDHTLRSTPLIDVSPLTLAIIQGNQEIVEILSSSGAEVHNCECFPLHIAVGRKQIKLAEALLAKGADVNHVNYGKTTPLFEVVKLDPTEIAIEIAELLIKNGADINHTTPEGLTPLTEALNRGNSKLAEWLITQGAAIDSTDSQSITPLHIVAELGSVDIAELLITKGAKIDSTCVRGMTPLHKAAYKGHTNIVELLLANGANVNSATLQGDTALYMAIRQGHIDIVIILLAKGAKREIISYLRLLPDWIKDQSISQTRPHNELIALHLDLIGSLFLNGIIIPKKAIIDLAVKKNRQREITELIENYEPKQEDIFTSVLTMAVWYQLKDLVEFLLDYRSVTREKIAELLLISQAMDYSEITDLLQTRLASFNPNGTSTLNILSSLLPLESPSQSTSTVEDDLKKRKLSTESQKNSKESKRESVCKRSRITPVSGTSDIADQDAEQNKMGDNTPSTSSLCP